MGQSFAVGGTLGLLLLCVPLLVLAVVVAWAVRQSRSQPAAKPATAPTPPAATAAQKPITESQMAASLPADTTLEPKRAQGVPPANLAAAIARSETAGDQAELAGLYIQEATIHVAAGRKEEAASRLRDAIRVAALNGLAAPHALARVELGDLYLSNGDPITACEQWQIARNLFHDLDRPEQRDDVDKRMLGNGCPTDWVLTDF